MVSKAFQVLSGIRRMLCTYCRILNGLLNTHSDAEKRAAYDRYGSDPESRFGGMSSAAGNGSAGFRRSPFGGATFEGELSPEDLFNMFFGGGSGMGGSPFGGPGGMFTSKSPFILGQ